jgi:hypothetical protein
MASLPTHFNIPPPPPRRHHRHHRHHHHRQHQSAWLDLPGLPRQHSKGVEKTTNRTGKSGSSDGKAGRRAGGGGLGEDGRKKGRLCCISRATKHPARPNDGSWLGMSKDHPFQALALLTRPAIDQHSLPAPSVFERSRDRLTALVGSLVIQPNSTGMEAI